MTFGTRNHSHIGANHFPSRVGNHRCTKYAAMRRGMNTDVFLIQNQNHPSPSVSHPISMQYPPTLGPTPHWLLLAGGSIQRTRGTPMASAGMKNASHSRRRLKTAQKIDSATTVPYAWT